MIYCFRSFQHLSCFTVWMGILMLEFHSCQGVPEQKLRAHLGSFGVTGNLALQPMYTLSGIFI